MSEERHGAKSENGIPQVHISELRLMSPSLEHEKRAFNAVRAQEYLAIANSLRQLQKVYDGVWGDERIEPIIEVEGSDARNEDPTQAAPLELRADSQQADALKMIFGQNASEEYRAQKVSADNGTSIDIFSGEPQSGEGMQVLTMYMDLNGALNGVSLRHKILGMREVELKDGSRVLAPLELSKVASVFREKKNILFGPAHAANHNTYVRAYLPFRTAEGTSVLHVPSLQTTFSNELVGTVEPHQHINSRTEIFTDRLGSNANVYFGKREFHRKDATFYPNHNGRNLEQMFLRDVSYGEDLGLEGFGFDLSVRLPHFHEEYALLRIAHKIDIFNRSNARRNA